MIIMFNYMKSLFFTENENKNNKSVKYELILTWYSNFTQYKNIIKSLEFDINNCNKDKDILNKHFDLYHKLSIPHRLVDYLQRTKTAMFSDNFTGKGVYHLNSLQIKKAYIKKDDIKVYKPPLTEIVYDMSIEVNSDKNWEII